VERLRGSAGQDLHLGAAALLDLGSLEAATSRLLAVVEGSQRRITGDRVAVPPADLVRRVVTAQPSLAGREVRVRVSPSAPDVVELAAPLVERALSLVLDNAARHGGGGPIDIDIELESEGLILRVRDDGTGFTWEQNGVRPQGGGGLAQAARLAVALGGSLTVQAGVRGGTVAELRVAAQAGGAALRSDHASRVLVVDDNQINRRLAAAMLGRVGVEADVVDSAQEALAAMATTRYGLVLMDVQMPLMDGREATRVWRESAGGATASSVPIVALTAHVGQNERDACVAAGMDDYLSKPFGIEELAVVCRRWLGADQAGPDR
jgi:CheY-like chemotaxis protein